MLSFKLTFSLSSFTFIKRLFSSSSLSVIRVVSSAYLRLLIFLLAVLIPACADELWMEVCDSVQETGSKIIPKKKKCKKAKWLSEEALQIAMKRREAKSKGEKERYTHLNTQRIARRDKKAFLSDQCKETEENNRMGKTRDLKEKLEIPRKNFMQRWAQ